MKDKQFHLSRAETTARCSIMGGRPANIHVVRTKSSKRVRAICEAFRRKNGMREADDQEIRKMKSDDLFDHYKATAAKPIGIHADWWRHSKRYNPVYLSYDNVTMSLKGFSKGSKAILCRMPTFVTQSFLDQHTHLVKDASYSCGKKSRR
jgi:hypothetical protein